ncbi:MAG: HRDC domain-containing protein [Bacteroidales bacterium]
MEFNTNPLLELAFDFVQHTNRNVFLTGKAGTGKTTFLHKLREVSPKRMIVVAPTGVAAINAGGVTIHSFFQIGFGPQIPWRYDSSNSGNRPAQQEIKRFNKNKIKIIRSLDLLVIDEVSMVRADLLDAIDDVLRRFRDARQPFGGVQLLMIGDLQQLSPVVKEFEWNMLRGFYNSAYFFSSIALRQTDYVSIELQEVFRQQDEKFIGLLNKVRDNQLDDTVLNELNSRYRPDFTGSQSEGYITLTTHNYQSANINFRKLNELPGEELVFTATIQNDFPEYSYPTDLELHLKVGAQVMFVKNDPSPGKRYFNGKIGVIESTDDGVLSVTCEGDDHPIEVVPVEWQNTRYSIDESTREIMEEVCGTFTQIPLKLAWAITIHKSQGLTFDRAIIDAAAAFAFGQVYVALSRCRTLEGLVLSSRISPAAIHSDQIVHEFNRHLRENHPDQSQLSESRRRYQQQLLYEVFDFSSLQGRLGYCRKIIRENAGSLTAEPEKITAEIDGVLRTELTEVADKFKKQIDYLIRQADGSPVAENNTLQERIKKAAAYFSEKMADGVIENLAKIIVETDNKTVRKLLKDSLENLNRDCLVAHAALESCKTGFDVKRLLEARAKAGIEETGVKTTVEKLPEPDETDADTALFKALKEWRHDIATEEGIPHYMVLHQKAIIGIAAFQPKTIADLKSIKGLGKRKIKQYGQTILNLVAEVTGEDVDLSSQENTPEEESTSSEKPKKRRGDSQRESIGMYRQGKTPDEIADIRKLARGTIISHLAWGVQEGLLDVHDLISMEKLQKVLGLLEKNPEYTKTDLREILGDASDWDEINMAFAYYHSKSAG